MKKIFFKLFYTVILFSALVTTASSKKFVIQNWGIEEGLVTNRIFNISNDKNGFIWLATDNGLVRFDGLQFVTYNRKNTSLIKNNLVTNIFTDDDKNICFTASKNYFIKNIDGTFQKIYNDTIIEKHLVFRKIFNFKNKLWILTYKGIFLLSDNKVFPQKKFLNIPSKNISAIAKDNSDSLWIMIRNDGLYKYSNGSLKKKCLTTKLNNRNITKIFFDSKNRIWLSSKTGIIVGKIGELLDSKLTKTFHKILLRDFSEDKSGNIWIATSRNGLFFIDTSNHISNITKLNGLSDDSITDFKIINGNIWVSTLNGGLNLVSIAKLNVLDKNSGLSSQYTNSFYNDFDNSILIGTNKGLFKLNNQNNITNVKQLPYLQNKHIYAIKRDKNNNLLIGTRLFGLYVVKKNKIINYNSKNRLGNDFVRTIFVDDDNTLYVGTNSGGVDILKQDSTIHITRKDGLTNDLIAFIHKSKDGKFWIGTSGGGVNILFQNKIIKSFNKRNGLKGNIISSIYEDINGTIWLSINGGGLAKIEDNKITNYTVKDGLFSNKLLNIACDKKNNFWFTTPFGIFSVKKNDIENYSKGKIPSINYNFYGKADGMPVERCTGSSPQTAILSNNNILFVSTAKGAVVINSNNINSTSNTIKLIIDKITVDDKTIPPKHYLNLPNNPQKVAFGFSAINFRNPHSSNIFYKLSNVDSEWQEAGENRTVSYSHLPFGKYTFEIKTGNNKKNNNIAYASVALSIPPRFWERKSLQLLSFILFILFVIAVTKYINGIKYKRKLHLLELEQALEKERIRISKDMHDEVGANLTKMSLLGEIAKKYISDPGKLKKYLNQITNTGVEVASSLDELVWTVNPKNDKLDRLISYIVQFVEDFLSTTDIKLNLTLPEKIPSDYISAELRHTIFSVIKEAVNNSIKHSKCSKISLKFVLKENILQVIIKDNGIGYDFNKIDNFSNGLNNMKTRIESVNGKIIFISKPLNGTEIKIELKI